jgi:rhamnogalacturonan endolyase
LVHGELVVFCYWRSSHYGQSNITVAEGEHWTKVVGPILLYANEGETPDAMWDDAKARLAKEETAWPYAWVDGGGYAHAGARAEVTGRIVLDDPLDPRGGTFQGRLTVGLTKTPYTVQTPGGPLEIDWQHDAKHSQHWAHSNSRDGRFTIPKVPAGTYSLHAFADGVLGELFKADVQVTAGGTVDLGDIPWTPIRHGNQLWELGKADRDAMEFAGAETFWHPDTALQFPKKFPQEITFRIGESDPATDWFYAHMPYLDDPNARIRPFFGIAGETKDATRHIVFALEAPVQGAATLRVALTGTGGNPMLQMQVNNQPAGTIRFGTNDGALTRHQIRGDWREQAATFDASLLKAGENTITLTVPQGSPNDGVIYDTLRLEVDPNA